MTSALVCESYLPLMCCWARPSERDTTARSTSNEPHPDPSLLLRSAPLFHSNVSDLIYPSRS